MVVAFLNYIFHPLLGRLMDPASFGDIQALFSLITQAGILFGAFSVVAVNDACLSKKLKRGVQPRGSSAGLYGRNKPPMTRVLR